MTVVTIFASETYLYLHQHALHPPSRQHQAGDGRRTVGGKGGCLSGRYPRRHLLARLPVGPEDLREQGRMDSARPNPPKKPVPYYRDSTVVWPKTQAPSTISSRGPANPPACQPVKAACAAPPALPAGQPEAAEPLQREALARRRRVPEWKLLPSWAQLRVPTSGCPCDAV